MALNAMQNPWQTSASGKTKRGGERFRIYWVAAPRFVSIVNAIQKGFEISCSNGGLLGSGAQRGLRALEE
jgi:hypothetical protein